MLLWLKALHLITMVCWFAGLFYLPRLFVYHSELQQHNTPAYARFCLMEQRLFWGIMTPSGLLTLLLGIGLIHTFHYSFSSLPHWLMWKLIMITVLIVYHFYCGYIVIKFKKNANPHHAFFYRWFNEFPVALLIGIILLAVFKPS